MTTPPACARTSYWRTRESRILSAVTDAEWIAQIRANPDDDQVRLAYADALVARGDQRGEYMRLAIANARRETNREQYERLQELAKLERQWAKEIGCTLNVQWLRGLPNRVWDTAQAVVENRNQLLAFPFRAITLLSRSKDLAAFAALPELARIEDLSLPESMPLPELAAVCASPHLTALRSVWFGTMSDEAAELVASAPWLAQLEALPLHKLTSRGFARLLASPLFRLRELSLYDCDLDEAGGRAFAECKLPRLEQLTFDRTRLRACVHHILGSANLTAVHTLRITYAHYLADEGADALGRSPHTQSLRTVSFESSGLGTHAVLALACARVEPFPELRTLELQDCLVEDPGAIALARSTRFPALTKLNLNANQLTRAGATAFADPTAIPSLTELRISGNSYPNGEYEHVTYEDQGYVVGGAAIAKNVGIDVIRSWFANRPDLRVE